LLAALVAPVPVRQFLRDYWPERVFHAQGPLSRLPAIFSSAELSSFTALVSRYRGWLGFGRGSQGGRMISVQQINPAHLYEMGLSVYLPDIAASVPGADAFLRQFESELGIAEGSAHITVWASPKGDGAPTHFDGEDVFSIQLTGTKRFEVAPMKEYAYPVGPQFGPGAAAHDDMYPQLESGFPDAAGAEFQGFDMKPGSVLFVPRGTWHRTAAAQDSFAISIGINPPSVAESFLGQLRYLLLQDPQWRRPIYGAGGDTRELNDSLEQILQSAPRAIQAISARDLVPVSEMERLRNIERTTRFQRDVGTRIVFEPGQGADLLEIRAWSPEAGERVTLKMKASAEYLPTFRWLAESRVAFSAGELADRFPDVPFEQHQKVLDVLTRARYLRLWWFPQLPKT
jgi:ribosomal protein L16 Arg81 hydroxylase